MSRNRPKPFGPKHVRPGKGSPEPVTLNVGEVRPRRQLLQPNHIGRLVNAQAIQTAWLEAAAQLDLPTRLPHTAPAVRYLTREELSVNFKRYRARHYQGPHSRIEVGDTEQLMTRVRQDSAAPAGLFLPRIHQVGEIACRVSPAREDQNYQRLTFGIVLDARSKDSDDGDPTLLDERKYFRDNCILQRDHADVHDPQRSENPLSLPLMAVFMPSGEAVKTDLLQTKLADLAAGQIVQVGPTFPYGRG